MAAVSENKEWLEADGLGGFASGTVAGARTRRYHGLLLSARTPPTGRVLLVNGFDAHVETGASQTALSSQRYAPGVLHPDGGSRLVGFEPEPWPRWRFALEDGRVVEKEIFATHGASRVVVRFRLRPNGRATPASAKAELIVRLFLSGRDPHSLHHENPAFRFHFEQIGDRLRYRPYDSLPAIALATNGRYTHQPEWYRRFLYTEERDRGLDDLEDLAAPGLLRFNLLDEEAVIVLAMDDLGSNAPAVKLGRALAQEEDLRRRAFPSPLERAGDAYIVRRGAGRSVVAGYPWFCDWGRDTFIAMRGLCLATGRLEDARAILVEWAATVDHGMLPNRFADQGDVPEWNSVDASLWFVIAAGELLDAARSKRFSDEEWSGERARIESAIGAIVSGYARGTRFGIGLDSDGLLAAGVPGSQVTWMDAKIGEEVFTPRIGKPVEVQALWANALATAVRHGIHAAPVLDVKAALEKIRRTFAERFWNEERGCLHDVVDVDHISGTHDSSLRPNQLFALGGLPLALLEGDRARRAVDLVEKTLLTPIGLRTLAPGEPGYQSHYAGDVRSRDGAYHQGTVWPWLLGAFVEAWLRVRGNTTAAKLEARARFLAPLVAHLGDAGLGHVSEIADANPPHTPRGCPFQAWSTGELLRLQLRIL